MLKANGLYGGGSILEKKKIGEKVLDFLLDTSS